MKRNKSDWTELVKTLISDCEQLFKIKILWDFADEGILSPSIAGMFLTPEQTKKYCSLDKPLILINLCAIMDDIAFICSIVHECRHCYQYAHRNENNNWAYEFLVGVSSSKNDYYESDLELDAYVFQEEFLKLLINDRNAKITGVSNFNPEKVAIARKQIKEFLKNERERISNQK